MNFRMIYYFLPPKMFRKGQNQSIIRHRIDGNVVAGSVCFGSRVLRVVVERFPLPQTGFNWFRVPVSL